MSEEDSKSRNILAKNDITTPEQLQVKVDEYLESCKPVKVMHEGKPLLNRFGHVVYEQTPATITGLALHLGYSTPDSFKNPEGIFKVNSDYWDIIVRAKATIGNNLNIGGLVNALNPRLVERNLACNHGMREEKNLNINAKVTNVSETAKNVLNNFDEEGK